MHETSVPQRACLTGLRRTWATICFFLKSLKWFYRSAKLENDGDGREGAALPTVVSKCLCEVALRYKRWKEEALGSSGGRVFGTEETSVQEPVLSKAGPPGQGPWGREAPEWPENRRRVAHREKGMKECAGQARRCGFYSQHTWETAIVGGFHAGEGVTSSNGHSGHCRARTVGRSSESRQKVAAGRGCSRRDINDKWWTPGYIF